MKKKVLFVQRILPHYRVAFFQKLSESLAPLNIHVTVQYGKEFEASICSSENLKLLQTANCYFWFLRRRFVWQKNQVEYRNFDLVITEHASSFLNNYHLLMLRCINKIKLAFWGHGKNFQNSSLSLTGEFIKSRIAKESDWWFAYSDLSRAALEKISVPKDKITVVYNTISNPVGVEYCRDSIEKKAQDFISDLNLSSKNILIFCGTMYPAKGLHFLFKASDIIRDKVEDIQLILIGDGPMQKEVEEYAFSRDWVKYVGKRMGVEKAALFSLSKAQLMPGAVGLAVIESFNFRCPVITTNSGDHGPEFEYIKNGFNGIVTDYTLSDYVSAVVEILTDDSRIEELKKGCEESSRAYSLDRMISHFKEGINNCLKVSK